MKRKNKKDTTTKVQEPKPEEQTEATPKPEEQENQNEIDPEYLEILLSYTEEDIEAMDMDPDEAENRYTGYEMEEWSVQK